MTDDTTAQDSEVLRELFGSFRAEWLRERLFSLFNEPTYFPTLRDRRPCALVGGRGTGKTTVLKCMSYEGQAALNASSGGRGKLTYIGIYHRVNSNRVTAFQGPEVEQGEWQRLFAHYTNLIIGELLLEFVDWYKKYNEIDLSLPPSSCARIARSFGFTKLHDLDALIEKVADAKLELEAYVNNLDGEQPRLSMLQSPIDVISEEILKLPQFRGQFFYILLDEYENYLDYQQVVLNTLIKHSGTNYVFKIGVRELGWRVKSTLNGTEQLISPADYELISIERRLDGNFAAFAKDVCETRLKQWAEMTKSRQLSLDELFPEFEYEKEAAKLGVSDKVGLFKSRLAAEPDSSALLLLDDLVLYVFWYLSSDVYEKALEGVRAYSAGDLSAKDRYNNYKYAMLFTIAGNGAQIQKYYCGNRVFATISRNNIRFYLHLISAALERHWSRRRTLLEEVSPADQTLAARSVGLQYLTELEGVTVQGVQLVKLILGFGRLFQLLSRNPLGSKPETMEFAIKNSGPSETGVSEAVRSLLTSAVMHLALVRSPGTKLATESDIKQWDYSLHPIFAPYFNFSHRRKRKLDVTEYELMAMVEAPQDTIRSLLKGKVFLTDNEPPAQLRLFDEYFEGFK